MIAHNTLQLLETDGTTVLLLAPYGQEEIEAVMPIDTEGLAFSDRQRAYIANATASEMIEDAQEVENRIMWGIYGAHIITPETFLGTVNLDMYNTGTTKEPKFTRAIQEIGTFVMDAAVRGRGIGTLAKLTVIEHQISKPETKAFIAKTAAQNRPAQRSLHKLGFNKVADYEDPWRAPFCEQQTWQLIREGSIGAVAKGDQQRREVLTASWQRYVDTRSDKRVVEVKSS